MPTGNCALCGLTRELRDSHLIPRKVYVYLRGVQRASNPVLITANAMRNISEQIHQHLLCSQCEQLFNENGEKFMLAHMALPKRFLLHEKLSQSKPFARSGRFEIYNGVSALGPDELSKLIYFGVSVFWRASVCTWFVPYCEKEVRIELGVYREAFRRYLLGDVFPPNAALTVSVATGAPPSMMALMFAPQLESKQPFHNYVFYIPGVEFQLHVGKRVTDPNNSLLHSGASPNYPIYFSSLVLERAIRAAKELHDKAKAR